MVGVRANRVVHARTCLERVVRRHGPPETCRSHRVASGRGSRSDGGCWQIGHASDQRPGLLAGAIRAVPPARRYA